MNEHIDTREGWQELDVVTPESIYQLAEYDPNDGSVVRAWVRVSPVPPLPTEPYTVIRAWPASGTEFECILRPNGQWWDIRGVAERDLQRAAHFVVLAEPRAVTAKAVLDAVLRLASWGDGIPIRNIEEIAREFGVSS